MLEDDYDILHDFGFEYIVREIEKTIEDDSKCFSFTAELKLLILRK